MYPHRIRLRGPWNCEPIAQRGNESAKPLPAACLLTMPCRWCDSLLREFTGRVRFRRAFGYPGRIDVYERVWLTLTGLAGAAEMALNGTPLTGGVEVGATREFDVTRLLRSRNELVVELDGTVGQGEVWHEVALEVRCTAFLRDLKRIAILIEDGIELRVTGQVIGEAERPLELYVLLEGKVVSYQVVTATNAGSVFDVHVTDLPKDQWREKDGQIKPVMVQVDLVNGATVWFSSSEQVIPQPVTPQGK